MVWRIKTSDRATPASGGGVSTVSQRDRGQGMTGQQVCWLQLV